MTYSAVGRGGDAIQILSLAEALREQGHEIYLVGGSPVAPYAFDSIDARLRSAARRLFWWGRDLVEFGLGLVAAWRALRMSTRRRVDLIVHRASVYDFAMAYVAMHLGVPLVVHLDGHIEAERRFLGKRYWRRLHAWAMRTLAREAATIVTPSRAVAAYYARLGLPPEKIVVHHNGVRARHLDLGLERAQTHRPLNNGRSCTLGVVGSLAKWHRVDLMLEALRELNQGATSEAGGDGGASRGDFRLVIIGRGEEYARLRGLAQGLGLGDTVEWRGPLSHDEAVQAMLEFDIAILPYTLPTGTPMKLSEYAAMGRPIVAPDYPNIRDMFTPGREIVLVPPGDPRALANAIRWLYAHPHEASALGTAAQARVIGRTWQRVAEALLRGMDGVSGIPATAAAPSTFPG